MLKIFESRVQFYGLCIDLCQLPVWNFETESNECRELVPDSLVPPIIIPICWDFLISTTLISKCKLFNKHFLLPATQKSLPYGSLWQALHNFGLPAWWNGEWLGCPWSRHSVIWNNVSVCFLHFLSFCSTPPRMLSAFLRRVLVLIFTTRHFSIGLSPTLFVHCSYWARHCVVGSLVAYPRIPSTPSQFVNWSRRHWERQEETPWSLIFLSSTWSTNYRSHNRPSIITPWTRLRYHHCHWRTERVLQLFATCYFAISISVYRHFFFHLSCIEQHALLSTVHTVYKHSVVNLHCPICECRRQFCFLQWRSCINVFKQAASPVSRTCATDRIWRRLRRRRLHSPAGPPRWGSGYGDHAARVRWYRRRMGFCQSRIVFFLFKFC